MIDNFPKISVLIICYKQEDVIRRALDSLIRQKDYIYEICINDDGSPDTTWNIILEYQAMYPDLIKPIQNNHNLGIFRNIEAAWKRPTGEIIYQLSGDDECPDGYFKHIIEFIYANKIDYQQKAICIYGDYTQINPNSSSIVYKNNIVTNKNALKLKVRQLLSNRSSCFSKNVLDRFIDVAEDRSYMVELTQDAELQIFTDTNYYIPILGNIYYAGIGVSKHLTKEEREEHLIVYDHFISFCKKKSIQLDKKDFLYIEYMKSFRRGQLTKAILLYFRSIDFSLGWKGLQINRIWFVLQQRILKKR